MTKMTLNTLQFNALVLFLIGLFSASCGNANPGTKTEGDKADTAVKSMAIATAEEKNQDGIDATATAYFASGCFWCVEAVYESVQGVGEVVNGYAGGHTENPTYEESNTGETGHAEAVKVMYDPSVIDFATLVDVYFGSQDPTQVNGH